MLSSHSCSLCDGPHQPAPYTPLGGRRGVLRWGTRDSSAGCVGGTRGATGTILAIGARHIPRDPFSMWASRLHSRRELRLSRARSIRESRHRPRVCRDQDHLCRWGHVARRPGPGAPSVSGWRLRPGFLRPSRPGKCRSRASGRAVGADLVDWRALPRRRRADADHQALAEARRHGLTGMESGSRGAGI